MIKRLLLFLWAAAALTACSSDDDAPEAVTPQASRTVIIYMAAENNLSVHAYNNLLAIKKGSASVTDGNLLVYVDRSMPGELPWLGRIVNGRVTDSLSLAVMGISQKDEYTSDPHIFEDVLRYVVTHYPAKRDYGLVLWGHSEGWLMQDSIAYTRGYGFDNGHNDRETTTGYWLNLPTMARVLSRLPVHWSYIFADCCAFMALESLYELRSVTDYIVGSAAETPGAGAPYETVVPAFFTPDAKAACTAIVDKYYAAQQEAQPLTIVSTSGMEPLAKATRTALQAAKQNITTTYPDMTGIIHYMYMDNQILFKFDPSYNIFYDAGHFMRKYAPAEAYTTWKQALDRAVIDKRMATRWKVSMQTPWGKCFSDFKVTEADYHGVSMFVPQNPEGKGKYHQYNKDIRKMAWYYAAGLKDMGW